MKLRRLAEQNRLPPEVTEDMVGALRRAGYDMADGRQQVMGVTALLAALRVFGALARPPMRGPYWPERNHPCPCGSGRKYKKCCAARDGAAPEPSGGQRFVSPSPLGDPQLVPRIHDPESFAQDMDNLRTLFEEEPALGSLRFESMDVAHFVAHRTERLRELWGSGGPDHGEDLMGALAAQYLRQARSPALLRRLGAALLQAAPDVVQDAQDFRSLALAVALADLPWMEEGADGLVSPDTANPLHTLIFRQTLLELLEAWARDLEAEASSCSAP